MVIIFNLESFISVQTSESLVDSSFFQRRLLDGALGHDVAVAVNLVDDMRQPVELGDASLWNLDLGQQLLVGEDILRRSVVLDDDLVELTSKPALNLVKQRSAVLALAMGQLSELQAFAGAPEEPLLGEVLLAEVVNSLRNVVVS